MLPTRWKAWLSDDRNLETISAVAVGASIVILLGLLLSA